MQITPWGDKANEIVLAPDRNIFWLYDASKFQIKIKEKNPIEPKIQNDEVINTHNYGIILTDKFKGFIRILENAKAQEEIEKMVKFYKEFEDNKIDKEELVLKDRKMNS